MYDSSRRHAATDIEESMDNGDYVLEIQARPLPLRKIYPARKKGQPHAYFPEGVKESLDRLCKKTGPRRLVINKLELFGEKSKDIGLNPNDLDSAIILSVEYEGQADPTRPLSLDDFGIHLITPKARHETPDTVSTTA